MHRDRDSHGDRDITHLDAADAYLVECRRAVEAGVVGAVGDAVRLCTDTQRPLPDWLVPAVMGLLAIAAPHVKQKGRVGRTATLQQRHDQDMLDQARWGAVLEVRALQEWYRAQQKLPRAQREARLEDLLNPGTNLDDAYALASECLNGTAAGGVGPDAIEKSYKTVQRAKKAGDARRYHLTGDWFLAGAHGPDRGN